MKVIGKLLIAVIILMVLSCNQDDEGSGPVLEIENLELQLTSITMYEAKFQVNYKIINASSLILEKVMYKKLNALEWKENRGETIIGLEPGVKYVAKSVLTVDEVNKESPEIFFTTYGFNHEDLLGDRILLNRQFDIFSSDGNSNFTEAAPLKGYLKVDNDSLELKSIEVMSDYRIIISLPENTQYFFEKDEEYIESKKFSIGLFSGEYYTEITESFNYSSNPLVKEFTLYNKYPQINSVEVNKSYVCENGQGFNKLKVEGNFWTLVGRFYDNANDNYNNPRELSLSITSVNNPAIQKVFLKEEDMVYDKANYTSEYCDKDAYYSAEIISYNPFHTLQNIYLHLSEENFPSGEYILKYDVVDYGDEEFNSNEYLFTLE
ncbi:hypothetical protein [Abyssalbus ytuae]|uniref:Uncharacterized protein n=1 Tax=Abyssalbus ytuae TaxID=2926907 RepID=A0A9E6ZZZ3_9FLAO|nr:hypothetical protein [Abyssalbus ytuae]UOB17061.1 hypothetical protein MQE35_15135 [Abyssalbus ytuae]